MLLHVLTRVQVLLLALVYAKDYDTDVNFTCKVHMPQRIVILPSQCSNLPCFIPKKSTTLAIPFIFSMEMSIQMSVAVIRLYSTKGEVYGVIGLQWYKNTLKLSQKMCDDAQTFPITRYNISSVREDWMHSKVVIEQEQVRIYMVREKHTSDDLIWSYDSYSPYVTIAIRSGSNYGISPILKLTNATNQSRQATTITTSTTPFPTTTINSNTQHTTSFTTYQIILAVVITFSTTSLISFIIVLCCIQRLCGSGRGKLQRNGNIPKSRSDTLKDTQYDDRHKPHPAQSRFNADRDDHDANSLKPLLETRMSAELQQGSDALPVPLFFQYTRISSVEGVQQIDMMHLVSQNDRTSSLSPIPINLTVPNYVPHNLISPQINFPTIQITLGQMTDNNYPHARSNGTVPQLPVIKITSRNDEQITDTIIRKYHNSYLQPMHV